MFIKKPRMDERWLGMVSASSVSGFLFLMCGLLGAQMYRMRRQTTVDSAPPPPPMDNLDNFSVVDEEEDDLQEDNYGYGFENPNFGASYVSFGRRIPL